MSTPSSRSAGWTVRLRRIREKALQYLIENELGHEPGAALGQLQAELFDALVEPKLINPTFITDFPIEISPLARRNDENPDIADRFELFIGQKEIANGFSELNDPLDQYERFAAQVAAKDAGDEEGMHMDEDYVRALGYGMPPALRARASASIASLCC